MAEVTIPILPCRSIDDTIAFYAALGFEVTYRQKRPNTYAVVERGGIGLHFFVLRDLDPTSSYSSCYVKVTTDIDVLYGAFTDGLRRTLGRLPSRGVPRIAAALLGDSKGDHAWAARILDLAPTTEESDLVRVRALVLRADLAVKMGDRELTRRLLTEVRNVDLGDGDLNSLEDDLRRARDLEQDSDSGSRKGRS